MSVDPDLDRVKILELDFSGKFERIAKPIDIVHSRLHFFTPHTTHTKKNGDHTHTHHYSKEFAVMIAVATGRKGNKTTKIHFAGSTAAFKLIIVRVCVCAPALVYFQTHTEE